MSVLPGAIVWRRLRARASGARNASAGAGDPTTPEEVLRAMGDVDEVAGVSGDPVGLAKLE
jgi:hypothetical protein